FLLDALPICAAFIISVYFGRKFDLVETLDRWLRGITRRRVPRRSPDTRGRFRFPESASHRDCSRDRLSRRFLVFARSGCPRYRGVRRVRALSVVRRSYFRLSETRRGRIGPPRPLRR